MEANLQGSRKSIIGIYSERVLTLTRFFFKINFNVGLHVFLLRNDSVITNRVIYLCLSGLLENYCSWKLQFSSWIVHCDLQGYNRYKFAEQSNEMQAT